MSIFRVLDKLENFVYNARPKLPLFWQDYAVFNREKLLNLIERTRTSLPQEMQRAKWISKEYQKFLQEGKERAEKIYRDAELRAKEIVELAKQERQSILSESDILLEARQMGERMIKEAESGANSIIERAKVEGRKMIDEAERYQNEVRSKASELLASSQAKAESMLKNSRNESESVKSSAYEYANKVISALEGDINKISNNIQNAQDRLNKIGPG